MFMAWRLSVLLSFNMVITFQVDIASVASPPSFYYPLVTTQPSLLFRTGSFSHPKTLGNKATVLPTVWFPNPGALSGKKHHSNGSMCKTRAILWKSFKDVQVVKFPFIVGASLIYSFLTQVVKNLFFSRWRLSTIFFNYYLLTCDFIYIRLYKKNTAKAIWDLAI